MAIADLINYCVSTATAGQRRYWTEQELAFVADNLPVMPISEIGEQLNRSPAAVKIAQVRRRIPVASKRAGWYTGNQAAKILGVDIHCILLLESRGLLHFDVLPGSRQIRRISKTALWIWAINPMHWIYFKPARVRDPRLRRLIELRRERWGDEWWTPGQVARHWGLTSCGPVNKDIHAGRLPAVRWGNWWILRSDALAHPFHPGKGYTGYEWSPRADAFLLRARDEQGLSFAAIGRLMKWPDQRVAYRYHLLKGMLRMH